MTCSQAALYEKAKSWNPPWANLVAIIVHEGCSRRSGGGPARHRPFVARLIKLLVKVTESHTVARNQRVPSGLSMKSGCSPRKIQVEQGAVEIALE
jgi:hypothetical protein